MPHPEPLVSRLRYASQVIQTRSPYLQPGDYRPFKVIQGNTVAFQGHSREYCNNSKCVNTSIQYVIFPHGCSAAVFLSLFFFSSCADVLCPPFLSRRVNNTLGRRPLPPRSELGGVSFLVSVLMHPKHNICLLYTSPSPRD